MDAMRQALDDMAAAGSEADAIVEADLAFHRALLESAHNEPLSRMEVVRPRRRPPPYGPWRAVSGRPRRRLAGPPPSPAAASARGPVTREVARGQQATSGQRRRPAGPAAGASPGFRRPRHRAGYWGEVAVKRSIL
ncbi:FCD domain-containing protein [Streptomyces sp. S465]|uniref:FCD domain-containing protein n=1 Tax=Streptomyces sp. S465 TaxID=2979468 RepID=UPI0022A80C85|nr:FCD domain-containing protein [Streptomyces sp. S465]WAP60718.1 FCD domain-containing protein [Streptomyces sp. S465]